MSGKNFEKLTISGWKWAVKDPSCLDPWFKDFLDYLRKNRHKSRRLRYVFKVDNGREHYYVKYDRPEKSLKRVKSAIKSKVKSEFDSAMLLENRAIPVVEYLGWGQKRSEGMLISKELPGAVNARDLWFSYSHKYGEEKRDFLEGFSSFLKKFLASGLYHPDFHIGNLMADPETYGFCIVDPYGISAPKTLGAEQKMDMKRIIGALRGEIDREEACRLIEKSGMLEEHENAYELWDSIVRAEAEEMEKLWPKRRRQILSGRSKYCSEVENSQGKKLFLRNSLSGEPIVETREIESPEQLDLEMQEMDREQAENTWLDSFKSQFNRIPHKLPLIWMKDSSSRKDLIFWEKK